MPSQRPSLQPVTSLLAAILVLGHLSFVISSDKPFAQTLQNDRPQTEPCPPSDLVDLKTLADQHGIYLEVDLRYSWEHNFVGRRLPGYEEPDACLLRKRTALAFLQAAKRLHSQDFQARQVFGTDSNDSIKLHFRIYDCYRPQRTVDYFAAWANNTLDTTMKSYFYPTTPKENLFSEGYIAFRSGHTRASTIDLTLVATPRDSNHPRPNPDPFLLGHPFEACFLPLPARPHDAALDMGTSFDCFHPASHTAAPGVVSSTTNITFPSHVIHNRKLLNDTLSDFGFVNYPLEWWHFSYPTPDVYYDFPIRKEAYRSALVGCAPVDAADSLPTSSENKNKDNSPYFISTLAIILISLLSFFLVLAIISLWQVPAYRKGKQPIFSLKKDAAIAPLLDA